MGIKKILICSSGKPKLSNIYLEHLVLKNKQEEKKFKTNQIHPKEEPKIDYRTLLKVKNYHR